MSDSISNYTKKKVRNQIMATFVEQFVSKSGFEKILNCSSYMMFIADSALEKRRLIKTYSCGNRFCPICSWKKARKDALAIGIMIDYCEKELNYKNIFVTLTVPNVSGDELESTIKRMNLYFRNFTKRKEMSFIKGYIRKLEVTYNEKLNNYHPHFHVIFSVSKSYFNSRYYLSKEKMFKIWQDCVHEKLDIRGFDMEKTYRNANLELGKYTAKDSDFLKSEQVFNVFYSSLKGKQLIVFSGCYKDIRKKYQNGELDSYKPVDETFYIYKLFTEWNNKTYLDIEKELMSDEELKIYNGLIVGEIEEDKME